MVRNAAVESEKKTRTIKSEVQTASRSYHLRTLIVILGGNLSIKMDGLVSSFKFEENNSMVTEAPEEFALASLEAAYEDP